jgi:hypothetical protein
MQATHHPADADNTILRGAGEEKNKKRDPIVVMKLGKE